MKDFARIVLIASLLAPGFVHGAAKDPAVALAEARSDAAAAQAELASVRESIAAVRASLGSQVATQREEAVRLGRELQSTGAFDSGTESRAGRLARENDALRRDLAEAAALLGRRCRDHAASVPLAEAAGALAALDKHEAAARPADGLAGLLAHLSRLPGMRTLPGEAATPAGAVLRGRWLVAGPLCWFESDDRTIRGLGAQGSGPLPVVVALPADADRALAACFSGAPGAALPVDTTLGKALDLNASGGDRSLRTHIAQGGPIGIVILLLGAAAWVVIALKWLELRRIRRGGPAWLRDILDAVAAKDTDAAVRHARAVGGPIGDLIETGIRNAGAAREVQEELLHERILQARPRLERWLPFLAVVASSAPLLGLLGTITGLMKTFQAMQESGTGDVSVLSSGIAEALVTTEFGLYVAIPALVVHALLSRKARGVGADMEHLALAFLNGLHGNPGKDA